MQIKLFEPGEFLTLKEASEWASHHLEKIISTSNISYLVNYGRIHKYGENGNAYISKNELREYYKSFNGNTKKQKQPNMSIVSIHTKVSLFHNLLNIFLMITQMILRKKYISEKAI